MIKITEFLAAFFPDEHERICLRFFMPREAKKTPNNFPCMEETTRARVARDTAQQTQLRELNQARGAYFVVNAGGNCDAAITGGDEILDGVVVATHPPGRFTACFAEADDLPIAEQHAALDAGPLPPSIRVETRKSVHAYWLLAGDNPGDQAEADWREAQRRLIAFFSGDKAIKNPSRLMRVPGFDHVSADGSRKRVECVAFDPDRRFTLPELLAAFPPVPIEPKSHAKREPSPAHPRGGVFATWDALRAELGRRITSHESARENGRGKIDCRAVCHDGQGATGLFYDPATNQAHCNKGCDQAAVLRAFGLPETPSGNPAQSVQSVQSVQASAQPEPWDLPVSFREFDLPAFPLEALSSWHRSYVEQLAEATQTPPDLAAMQSLAAIAATVARNVEIEARQGWREPLCIFTLTVAESANRKSAVVSEVTRPLERFEGDLLAEMREEIAEAVNERRILEARLEKAQKDCAKLDGPELAERKEEARKIAIEIEHHVIPVAPRFFVDDTTSEALASKMAEQGGRIALFSAEGGIFETMAGRYSNGAPNIDVYLKGHAGDSLRVDRRQRSERIERPALTIGLAVQSDVIRGLAQKPGFRGRGLLGRFLYSLPPSRLGSRKSRAKSISTEAAHTYERYLIRLAAIKPADVEDGEPEPIALRLSGEADDYLAQFQDEIEPELAEGGDLATISEWAGKLCGAAVRLAGILHCADHAMNSPRIPGEVPADTFKRAIQIARYLIPHSLAAHAEMGADPLIEDARYILRWLIRERLDDASKRDIHRGCRGRFKKITELDPVLALLEDHNYLRPILPKSAAEARPGRKASQIYNVNPALYLCGQNGHNGHNPVKTVGAATGENDIYLSGQNGQNGHNAPENGNSVHSVHSVHNPEGWNFEPPPCDELPENEAAYTPPAPKPATRRMSL